MGGGGETGKPVGTGWVSVVAVEGGGGAGLESAWERRDDFSEARELSECEKAGTESERARERFDDFPEARELSGGGDFGSGLKIGSSSDTGCS